MGWTFGGWETKEEVVDEVISGFSYEEEILAKRVVEDSLWVVFRRPNREPSIYLFMLDEQGGEWGYKDIHEDMGPYDFSCPKEFLKLCPDDSDRSDYSKEWRKKILAGV